MVGSASVKDTLQRVCQNGSEKLDTFFAQHEALHHEWLRKLHSLAEPAFAEHETSKFVKTTLQTYCSTLDVSSPFPSSPTAVLAVFAPAEPVALLKPILLRADMDALRMKGAATTPPRIHEHVHHGCGHDGHMACLLAAAHGLHNHPDLFERKVVLFFQPAEEIGSAALGGSGARVAVNDGLFETIHPDITAVYALHCWPSLKVGEMAIGAGPIMGTSTKFRIEVQGTGGHAATPGPERSEPLLAGCAIVCNGQSICSRGLSPFETSALAFTKVQNVDCEALNVCPSAVLVQGVVRALTSDVKKTVLGQLYRLSKGIGDAYGCSIEFTTKEGYPATTNTENGALAARGAALRSGISVTNIGLQENECKPSLCAEDFSILLEKRPGAYVWLGNGGSAQLHTAELRFNEESLSLGARFFLELVRGQNCKQ